MLLNVGNVGVPVFDTTLVHCEAALRAALQGHAAHLATGLRECAREHRLALITKMLEDPLRLFRRSASKMPSKIAAELSRADVAD